MEDLLLRAEQRILGYHGDQLRHWVDEQRFVLQQSAALDADALAAQAMLCESCLESVRADVEAQRAAKAAARRDSAAAIEACEREFCEELRALGGAYEAEAAGLLAKAQAKVRQSHDVCEGKEWEHLDRSLRAVLLKHARAHHGFGVVDGVAELWERGEFRASLRGEAEGWAASQRSDVARLHADVEAECGGALQALRARLEGLSPEAVLGRRPGAGGLAAMAEAEARRLRGIEAELLAGCRAEIEEVLEHCEEGYRRCDCELQRVLARTQEARARSAASMRQYRLALCRWRLDYQRAFHARREALLAAGAPRGRPAAAPGGRRRLEALRGLARGLWARSRPPVRELSRFLGGAAGAAASAGLAAPLLRVYEEELRRHGALPLLEHASRPELLQCWLQALQPLGEAAAPGIAET